MQRTFFNRRKRGNPSKMNTFVTVVFWASLLFFLAILTIGYYRHYHKPAKPKHNFLNLAINPASPKLKLDLCGLWLDVRFYRQTPLGS